MHATTISVLIDPIELAGAMGRISGLLRRVPTDPDVCRIVLQVLAPTRAAHRPVLLHGSLATGHFNILTAGLPAVGANSLAARTPAREARRGPAGQARGRA